MLDALLFWLVAWLLGVAALPLVEVLLGRLPGGGLSLARPLGLAIAAFPVWLLASLELVPYRRAGVVAAVAVLAVAGALLLRRGLGRPAAGSASAIWLGGEIVFTVAFAGHALLRSFVPEVWQTEKPMDMAFVNAVNRSDWFPPADPWQSGEDVNYYYWGHYLVAFLIRLTGVAPEVGYNLGLSVTYGLVAGGVYGLAATLWLSIRRTGEAPHLSPVLVGVGAAALASVAGNVAGGVQLLQHTGRVAAYDWWSPSRVIDGTANEFPFFSFLLGDLHAHMLATPLTLVTFSYAVQLALSGPPPRAAGARLVTELALSALVLGSLFATNTFDFATACLVGAGALAIWSLDGPSRLAAAAGWGAAWLAASVLLFLPFWLSFDPPTTSLAFIDTPVSFGAFARDYLLIYGVALWTLAALFGARFRMPGRYAFWLGSTLLFLLVLLEGERLGGRALALLLVAAAAFATLSARPVSQPYRVVWLLVTAALGLIASGEVVYVRDVFDGTESFRFNTVFKTGYQAWFLLAVVGAVLVPWAARWLGPRLYRAWLAGLGLLLALASVYPLLGPYSRSAGFSARPTLDGMHWLRVQAPDDVAAISWLRRSVSGSPTLLETVGRDYDPEGRGRVSTFTGLPAVLGWAGHEVQWGHDPGRRAADVAEIYSTPDIARARSLLARYDVRYVFVGDLERRDFGEQVLAKFERLGKVVFRSGNTLVYRVEPRTR